MKCKYCKDFMFREENGHGYCAILDKDVEENYRCPSDRKIKNTRNNKSILYKSIFVNGVSYKIHMDKLISGTILYWIEKNHEDDIVCDFASGRYCNPREALRVIREDSKRYRV